MLSAGKKMFERSEFFFPEESTTTPSRPHKPAGYKKRANSGPSVVLGRKEHHLLNGMIIFVAELVHPGFQFGIGRLRGI